MTRTDERRNTCGRLWPTPFPGVLGMLVILLGIATTACCQQPQPPGRIDAEESDLRPGLVAHYRSLQDQSASLWRVDVKPAFHLGASSPHPRLPSGPFEVSWSGILTFQEPGPFTFQAAVCGEVEIKVDGVVVLQGRGEQETSRVDGQTPLQRPTGRYTLNVTYRSLPNRPARLQIWWKAPSFADEPLPAWRLHHLAKAEPRPLTEDQQAETGRQAILRLGCARCHSGVFPGVADTPPGPSLIDLRTRVTQAWLREWLADPTKHRADARMPHLFAADRTGFVERWLVADHLLSTAPKNSATQEPEGDHRMGRRQFVGFGCGSCHLLPDLPRAEQPDASRTPFVGLADRFTSRALAAFLLNPQIRYPDGRMPHIPLTPEATRNIAAYLLLWSKPREIPAETAPTEAEIQGVVKRLGTTDARSAGAALIHEKRCGACHAGLEKHVRFDLSFDNKDPHKGCLSDKGSPRFMLDEATRRSIRAYLAVAPREKHPSPFADRQRRLDHLGCVRCHQRDSDRPSPLETTGSTLGGAWLQNVPFQRAPRLTYPHQKYTRTYLTSAIREGVRGLRPSRYTYLMPAFGPEADTLVRALAEADGDLPEEADPPVRPSEDPTLGSLSGLQLVGFQGYACVSCHQWNGQMLSEPDPGAVGTDLTRVTGRIRRTWFDRYLEGPTRFHPGTPMPAIFTHGKGALLTSVLDGQADRQKEALWSYLTLGKAAPSPKPAPPLPVTVPDGIGSVLVAQIPVRLPEGRFVEAICLLSPDHDLVVYDVGTLSLHGVWTGAQLLRSVQGRLRTYGLSGTPLQTGIPADGPLRLLGGEKSDIPTALTLIGYDRLPDGVRIRWQAEFARGRVDAVEVLRLQREGKQRRLIRTLSVTGVPPGHRLPARDTIIPLPNTPAPPPYERTLLPDPGRREGSLTRPGYRAIAYPRPKTASGEDLVMPGAVAVDPRDHRVFVSSLKTGSLYLLRDPKDNGQDAQFEDYAGGLYQDAYSMWAEPGELFVLHRRNLTRLTDTDADGRADRFDRLVALPHGIADTYDYAYGLVRNRDGSFVLSYAPYANRKLPGSGGALRLTPGRAPEEIGYGFRNPVGWCAGPDGEIFATDNQGEWVATNKLCHVAEGRYHGFPNPDQRQHTTRPMAKTTLWVPYAWAKSINGVAYDNTGGKFGPFAGQFFLAELMFGGALIRADLEKVNGVWQGACFPFWGPGLLGPLTLAFDPRGRLYVGGITEPGWMVQPDRGALYRIDPTGETPFEIQKIRIIPNGFRLIFTRAVEPTTARQVASYMVESYRYEYTGAYGSPELDRRRVEVKSVTLSADGRSVELTMAPPVRDRVYMIGALGVRSEKGESLVSPTGAYTVNEIPTR